MTIADRYNSRAAERMLPNEAKLGAEAHAVEEIKGKCMTRMENGMLISSFCLSIGWILSSLVGTKFDILLREQKLPHTAVLPSQLR